MVFLCLAWREVRMWALCLCFSGCTAVGCFCSIFGPAIGPSGYFGIAPGIQALLPSGAGQYYLPIFQAYRPGGLDTIDLHYFEGVVTFPSVHICMALMAVDALRGMRWVFVPMLIWNSLTIVSTLPIGGHYGVDLIAGGLVWAAFAWWSRRLEAHCIDGGSAPAQPAR
jgi:membrane-associated phospholipid phosphatase